MTRAIDRLRKPVEKARDISAAQGQHAYLIQEPGVWVSYHRHPWYTEDGLRGDLGYLPAFAGYDIGKRVHPSHISVVVGDSEDKAQITCLYQIASIWLNGVDYRDQIEFLRLLCHDLNIVCTHYDSTGREIEWARETGELPRGFKGIHYTGPEKRDLGSRFQMALEKEKFKLMEDHRQARSILKVTQKLQADDSGGEHGDAFWSNAMALRAIFGRKMRVDSVYLRGLYG